jgi:hypothetical protein
MEFGDAFEFPAPPVLGIDRVPMLGRSSRGPITIRRENNYGD